MTQTLLTSTGNKTGYMDEGNHIVWGDTKDATIVFSLSKYNKRMVTVTDANQSTYLLIGNPLKNRDYRAESAIWNAMDKEGRTCLFKVLHTFKYDTTEIWIIYYEDNLAVAYFRD